MNSEPCNKSIKFSFTGQQQAKSSYLVFESDTPKNKQCHLNALGKCSNMNSASLRLLLTSFWEKKQTTAKKNPKNQGEQSQEGWRKYDVKLNGITWMPSRIYYAVCIFKKWKKPLVSKGKKWISTVHKHYVVLKCLVRHKCNYPLRRIFEISFFCY